MYDLSKNDKIEGWMSLIELCFLHMQAQKMDSIVELGGYNGRSAYALLSGCKGHVTIVDNFSMCSEEELFENIGHFNNLTVFKGDSSGSINHLSRESVDMVFIDAGHTYEAVKKDIETWVPITKKLICGHDYDFGEVRMAVDEVFGSPDGVIGSVWYKIITK